jgi:hypothetical protein
VSVINDALKRASQKPAALPSAAELAAESRPTEERRTGFPVLVLLIVLIPLIALGVWFLAKGLQLNEEPKPVPMKIVTARAPDTVPAAPERTAPAVTHEPRYKLQGIFWRPAKPSAVINGKMVYVGDRVEHAQITAIDQESVSITVNGESKVLLLP